MYTNLCIAIYSCHINKFVLANEGLAFSSVAESSVGQTTQSGKRVSFCSLTCQFSEALERPNQVGVINSEMHHLFILPIRRKQTPSTKQNPFNKSHNNYKMLIFLLKQPKQQRILTIKLNARNFSAVKSAL